MPTSETDETKVPHYFGPWPNWANSPYTLPNATVDIQGDGSFTTGQTYTVDYTPPAVMSSVRLNANPTALSAVSYRVTFSETVTGVDKTDFALTTFGMTGSSIASVTGAGATRTVKVNVGSGSGTIRLDVVDNDTITIFTVVVDTGTGDGTLRLDIRDNDTIVDATGNPLAGAGIFGDLTGDGSFNGLPYDIDKTVPTVSIALGSPNPTGAASVDYIVTFSEPVTGVEVADFILNFSGVINPTITGLSPAAGPAALYTVTVNTGTNSGTISLDLPGSAVIYDQCGQSHAGLAGDLVAQHKLGGG